MTVYTLSLAAGLLDVGNEVSAILLLLQSRVHHLGAGDELLRVGQVGVQGGGRPGDPLVDVGLRVGIARRLAGLPAHHPTQVGALLVLAAGLDGVALGAGPGEDLLPCRGAHPVHGLQNTAALQHCRPRGQPNTSSSPPVS